MVSVSPSSWPFPVKTQFAFLVLLSIRRREGSQSYLAFCWLFGSHLPSRLPEADDAQTSAPISDSIPSYSASASSIYLACIRISPIAGVGYLLLQYTTSRVSAFGPGIAAFSSFIVDRDFGPRLTSSDLVTKWNVLLGVHQILGLLREFTGVLLSSDTESRPDRCANHFSSTFRMMTLWLR